MKRFINEPERVAKWAAEQLSVTGFHQPYTAFGSVNEHDEITAAAVFNNYTGIDIEVTVVGKGKFTRLMWMIVLDCIWVENKCTRCTMRTRESNEQAIKVCIHFGARVEGRLRKYYGTEDAVILGLLKEECRYVEHFQSPKIAES